MTTPCTMPAASWAAILCCAACCGMGSCSEGSPPQPGSPEVASSAPEPAPWFAECAAERGIDFVHDSGHRDRPIFPEIVCGGAAFVDVDADGFLDVYLVQAGAVADSTQPRPPNRLFRNRGDGTFEDVTEASGAGDRGYGIGVAAGDYDGDGSVDLYVTNLGRNTLLRNDGTGRFTDVTESAAVGETAWSSSAAFVDYDVDGDLDLFVVNYIRWSLETERTCLSPAGTPDYCSPQSYNAPARDTLYRNNGDGTFTDVSMDAGLNTVFGNGLGVVCFDANGDNRPDIYVANDGTPNQLWINQGDGTFRDAAPALGCAVDQDGIAKGGMGVTAVDIDDDADRDVLVVNLVRESDSLYRNQGEFFVDGTIAAGLAPPSRRYTRFGMGLVDFDNDGWLDLYEACGNVIWQQHSADEHGDAYAQENLLMRGSPDGRFSEIPGGGTAQPLVHTSRAAAFGDFDNDGGIDVLVLNRDSRPYLLRNVAHRSGNWIIFRVLETHGADAIGATVELRIAGRRLVRDVMSAYSYCAANDPRVHVGLGAERQVHEVSVRWLDGAVESFGSLAANQVVTLHRGRGAAER